MQSRLLRVPGFGEICSDAQARDEVDVLVSAGRLRRFHNERTPFTEHVPGNFWHQNYKFIAPIAPYQIGLSFDAAL